MKKSIQFFALSIILIGFVACSSQKSSVKSTENIDKLRDNLEQADFTFTTDYAIPSGRFLPRRLTSIYEVKISNDTLYSHLPYFGEAYAADFGSTDSPLSFVSIDFTYTVSEGKKRDSRRIRVDIKDRKYPVTYYFTVWDNAKADLVVSDYARRSITFQGEIRL